MKETRAKIIREVRRALALRKDVQIRCPKPGCSGGTIHFHKITSIHTEGMDTVCETDGGLIAVDSTTKIFIQ